MKDEETEKNEKEPAKSSNEVRKTPVPFIAKIYRKLFKSSFYQRQFFAFSCYIPLIFSLPGHCHP